MKDVLLSLSASVAITLIAVFCADADSTNTPAFRHDSLPDYLCLNPGIVVPDSCIARVLEVAPATGVAGLHALVYQRRGRVDNSGRGKTDFLGISLTLYAKPGEHSSLLHLSYVLQKSVDDRDWSEARIYHLKNSNLLSVFALLSDDQFRESLISIDRESMPKRVAGSD